MKIGLSNKFTKTFSLMNQIMWEKLIKHCLSFKIILHVFLLLITPQPMSHHIKHSHDSLCFFRLSQDLTFLNRLQIISSMIRNTYQIKFVTILLQKIHMKTNLSMLKLRWLQMPEKDFLPNKIYKKAICWPFFMPFHWKMKKAPTTR